MKTVFLDGDDLRSIFGAKWGYDHADRTELARVYLRLASHLSSQGITVVFSAVAMYVEIFEWFRRNVPNAFLAYLNTPIDVRIDRDRKTKRVYKQLASADARYSEPVSPDIVVDNYGDTTADGAASEIVAAYLSRGATRAADRGKGRHWNSTYLANVGLLEPSPFSRFAGQLLRERTGTLLEVGCGNGRDAVYFASIGADVTGIDTSEAAVDLCNRLHEGKNIRFFATSISGLASSSPETRYDTIYSRFVLHAMTGQEEAEFLAGSYKMLKDDGVLFIECRSINDPLSRLGEIISPTERIHGHYRRFIILDELIERLQSAGFAAERVMERMGLAVFGDEDPVVIRIVCTKRMRQ